MRALSNVDNRGAGRTPLAEGPLTVATMADDAATLLRRLEIPAAHSGRLLGGAAIAQELALRHPKLVRSLVLSTWASADAYFRAMFDSWRWMAETAPSERAFLEAFFVWVYTARAHADGKVAQIVEEAVGHVPPRVSRISRDSR